MLIIGFLMLIIAACCAGYFLNKRKVNIGFISIGIDYFQVLAIFANAKVKWPDSIKELFHILSAFNLNIEVVAPECLIPSVSFKQKWYFIMLLPLSLGTLFILIHIGQLVHGAFIKGRKQGLCSHSASLISSFLALFYILYLYLTRSVFEVFNCAPTEPSDGKEYLQATFEECGVPGGTQMTLMAPAVVAVIVYVLGYPGFLLTFFTYRYERIMEDQLLRAKGAGNDHLTNPNAYYLRKAYSRVYYQFKPDYFYWILAIVVRKALLAVTSLMFRRSAPFQLAAALLVLFIAYAAQVRYTPYMSPGDHESILKSHVESSYTSAVHARLRQTLQKIEARGKKRVYRNVLTKSGKVDYGALIGVLGTWMFNYNTLEAVMIASAVLVSLMGIMYDSSASSIYRSGKDGITAVIILNVALTIIYYFSVVITEITILASEDSRRKALAKQRTKKAGDAAEKSPKARASTPGAPGLPEPEFNVGKMDSQMNPMFLQQDAQSSQNLFAGAADAIVNSRTPPTPDLWLVFQTTFLDMQQQVDSLTTQLNGAKLELQRLQSSVENGEAVGASNSRSSVHPMKKNAFDPTLATSADGESPIATSRSANVRPQAGARSAAVSPQMLAAGASGRNNMMSMAAMKKSVEKRGASRSRLRGEDGDDSFTNPLN
jgi:hypothetical protein